MSKLKNCKIKPLLPWVGGKYRLADEIIDILDIPNYCNRLISPTCGGLGFDTKFYCRYPKFNIYSSDTNNWLINLYSITQSHPNKFYKAVKTFDDEWKSLKTKEKRKDWYYRLRNQFNDSQLSKFDNAVLFLVLVKTGYNGLMQINNKGKLTTAFGFGVVKSLINGNNFEKFVKFAQQCNFSCIDYLDSIKYVNNKSVIYIDPLYKDSKQMYGSDKTIEKLIHYMKLCEKKGAAITAMSNSYDPSFWKKLLPSAEIHTLERNQGVHRDVVLKGRHKVQENLIILRA